MGKGWYRRPATTSKDEFDKNFERTFPKKPDPFKPIAYEDVLCGDRLTGAKSDRLKLVK